MRLDFDNGTALWCRGCAAERPHYVHGSGELVCATCHCGKHRAEAMLQWSVDDTRDPVQLLPPERAWGAKRRQRGGRL